MLELWPLAGVRYEHGLRLRPVLSAFSGYEIAVLSVAAEHRSAEVRQVDVWSVRHHRHAAPNAGDGRDPEFLGRMKAPAGSALPYCT